MTDVEYTEKAIDHLENLDSQVADRVMNKVDEATDWTEHRLEPLSGYPYYKLGTGDYRAIITWDRSDDPLIEIRRANLATSSEMPGSPQGTPML